MARTPKPRASSTRRAAGSATKRASSLGVAGHGTEPARTYVSKPVPIDLAAPEHRFYRADLEIHGIFHGEASYEGRIFFNNPKADAETPCEAESGYVNSFYIFGHGGCLGDPGHCEVNDRGRGPYDKRPPHPLTPATKRVMVTDALREIAKTAKEVTITVVPVVTAANELCDAKDVFRCESMTFVTYNG